MNEPHCFISVFHFYAKPGNFAFIGVVLANILFDFKFPVILAVSSDTMPEKDSQGSAALRFLQRNSI